MIYSFLFAMNAKPSGKINLALRDRGRLSNSFSEILQPFQIKYYSNGNGTSAFQTTKQIYSQC